jgi:hypothetical protein
MRYYSNQDLLLLKANFKMGNVCCTNTKERGDINMVNKKPIARNDKARRVTQKK